MDQYSFFLPYLSQNKNIKNLKEEVMRKRRWLFTAFFCCFAALLCCLTSISKAKAEDSYTVTYHANGGTFEDGSVTYGPPVEKKLPKLSRQTMSVMMAVLIPMDTVTTKRLQTK
jgi:quinol-cytochrome oxidoreductase complex cytochrome b subunit